MKNIYLLFEHNSTSLLYELNLSTFYTNFIQEENDIKEIIEKGTYIQDKNVIIEYFILINDIYGRLMGRFYIWDIDEFGLTCIFVSFSMDECNEIWRIKKPDDNFYSYSKVDIKGMIIV